MYNWQNQFFINGEIPLFIGLNGLVRGGNCSEKGTRDLARKIKFGTYCTIKFTMKNARTRAELTRKHNVGQPVCSRAKIFRNCLQLVVGCGKF